MTIQADTSTRTRAGTGDGYQIEAHDLVKTYPKGVRALDGLSFAVPAGTVFGLLGPNGAGKSTTVKILTTLAQADSGTATVAGLDVRARAAQVRHAIGVVAQRSGADPMATGRENLLLTGRIQGLRGRDARGAGRRAARPVRPGRRGRPARPHLLRWHAAAAGRGAGPDQPAAGAVPRRADRGPGPGVAHGHVGRDRAARRRRRAHHPADHPLPGGGRPARQPPGHRGPRAHRRGRHARRAQGPAPRRRRAHRPRRSHRTRQAACRPGSGCPPSARSGWTATTSAPAPTRARPPCRPSSPRSTTPGVPVRAATVARPSLDDVYLRHAGRRFADADQSPATASTGGAR